MLFKGQRINIVLMVFVCSILTGIAVLVLAGSLNPPGAPTSGTMKTLDQVEARIPIPGSSYPTTTFTISAPGSYYLTGNRLCLMSSYDYGIHITASNVTLDLNGYALIGGLPEGRSGIYIEGPNVEVRNGTIRDFPEAGVTAGTDSIRLINLRVLNNGNSGISLGGNGSHVEGCTVANNGMNGIYAWNNSRVCGNTCYHNGDSGIFARWGSVVSGNSCYSNGDYGIFGYDSLVCENSCYGNTLGSIFPDNDSTIINNQAP